VADLYVKRDDLSGSLYGGDKPRKLEFLLADALRRSASHVMTFGAAGSNHALATALYARQLGMKCVSMLMPQANARYVRQNLLWSRLAGAELRLVGSGLGTWDSIPRVYVASTQQMLVHRLRDGRLPAVIAPGGSSLLGTVGFVNAAFELREQAGKGELPEPDCMYVAAGSVGTAAGLALGLRAAGLKTKVLAVRVTDGGFASPRRLVDLASRTSRLLRGLDSSFPDVGFLNARAEIRNDCCGGGYAVFSEERMAAVSLMWEREGIRLDGTYTGKTLAALSADAAAGALKGKTVLFWNTLNSVRAPPAISAVDYHELPGRFHRFFEQPVQPLDRAC
jgi:D-cysteine desulfhydrase